MLYTLAAVLIALWLVGVIVAYTLGGLIHLLLVVAVVMLAWRLIQRGRAA